MFKCQVERIGTGGTSKVTLISPKGGRIEGKFGYFAIGRASEIGRILHKIKETVTVSKAKFAYNGKVYSGSVMLTLDELNMVYAYAKGKPGMKIEYAQ
jgi:hypothetical protein